MDQLNKTIISKRGQMETVEQKLDIERKEADSLKIKLDKEIQEKMTLKVVNGSFIYLYIGNFDVFISQIKISSIRLTRFIILIYILGEGDGSGYGKRKSGERYNETRAGIAEYHERTRNAERNSCK